MDRLWNFCRQFYSSPVASFLGKSIHFAVFVLLYTYVGITLRPDIYRLEEGIMHVWIFSLITAEMRQFLEIGRTRQVSSISFYSRICYSRAYFFL